MNSSWKPSRYAAVGLLTAAAASLLLLGTVKSSPVGHPAARASAPSTPSTTSTGQPPASSPSPTTSTRIDAGRPSAVSTVTPAPRGVPRARPSGPRTVPVRPPSTAPRIVPVRVTATAAAPATVAETSCPASAQFSVVVSVSAGPAVIEYDWYASDLGAGPTRNLSFTGSGSQSQVVPLSRTVSGNLSAWEQLQIISPASVSSEPIPFTVSCASLIAVSVTGSNAFITPACDEIGSLNYGTITVSRAPAWGATFTWLLDGAAIHTVALDDATVGTHAVSGTIRFTGPSSHYAHQIQLRVTVSGHNIDSAPVSVRPLFCL
jgi:hypothetical protein